MVSFSIDRRQPGFESAFFTLDERYGELLNPAKLEHALLSLMSEMGDRRIRLRYRQLGLIHEWSAEAIHADPPPASAQADGAGE